MSAEPIFLVGADRSGIGLLGELLDAHPNIAVAKRTNLWAYYYGRYGSLADPANLDRCLNDMLRYRRIRDLQPDAARLRRDFSAGEATYERLFGLLLRQHQQRQGKLRWCDKSLNAERHAHTILRAFRQGRMIHVIRDPRDRYASEANHRGRRRGGVSAGLGVWLASCRLAERNRREFPERYLVVRYEDLVRAPEAFLRDLCAFLDEPFAPLMLRDPAITGPGEAPARRFWDTSIGRYRRDLTRSQIAWIQAIAGGAMDRLGYASDPVAGGVITRVHLWALQFPLHALLLMLWRARLGLRSRLGARPSHRRLLAGS